jgi:hypothetical protein
MSAASLYRAIAAHEVWQRVPGVSTSKHLSVSHVHAVLGLHPERQSKLLRDAEENGWTVERLTREALGSRLSSPKRGRPRLPEYVKSTRRLHHIASNPRAVDGVDLADGLAAPELADLEAALGTVVDRCARVQKSLRDVLNRKSMGRRWRRLKRFQPAQ